MQSRVLCQLRTVNTGLRKELRCGRVLKRILPYCPVNVSLMYLYCSLNCCSIRACRKLVGSKDIASRVAPQDALNIPGLYVSLNAKP